MRPSCGSGHPELGRGPENQEGEVGDPESPCRAVYTEGELADEGMESGAERCCI